MSKLPAKHHYVPEFLIWNFEAPNGRVYFYDKDRPKKGIEERNPGNILYQKHIYTRTHSNGSKDVQQELDYAKLEHAVAPVVVHIVESARSGKLPNLTIEQKGLWDAFLYEQWRRVPDLHDALFTPELYDNITRRTIADLERLRPLRPDERELINDPKFTRMMLHNARVNLLGSRSANVMQVLGSRAIAIVRLTKPNKSFVLGSRPVVKLTTSSNTHLSHPEVEFWLPIAPDVLAGIGRHDGEELLLPASDDFVRGFNLSVFKHSTKVVARSKQLLESILAAR